MTPWEIFITRRKIDVKAFLSYNALTTRDAFLAHLREHGIQPPPEEMIKTLFPPPPEVKIEAAKAVEKKEVTPTENTSPPRSDLSKGKRDYRTPSGSLPPEDRGDKDP